MKGKFAIPPPYGCPSPERRVASKAWEGEPSGLRQYVTMSLLADSYLRE